MRVEPRVYDERVREALAAVVTAAVEATSLRELAERALPRLRRIARASTALLYRYDDDGRLVPIAGEIAELIEHYGRNYLHHDPVHRVPRTLPPVPRVVLATQQVDRGAFRRSAAYGEFYRPFDLEHHACVCLKHVPYGAPGMTGLLLSRQQRTGEFQRVDARAIGEVLPVLSAAAARAQRLHALDRERDALDALASSAAARIVLSPTGATLWMSPAAARLVPAIPDELRGAARQLAEARLAPPTAIALAGTRAHLSVMRARSGERMILVELDAPHGEELARRFGLTPTEGVVLGELAAGLSTAAIAARLGVSIETVRTHVRRVLGKLGVASRTQAALAARDFS